MPDTIISDATCFILLANVDELGLLRATYGNVITTSRVLAEFGGPLPDWVMVRDPIAISTRDSIGILGSGEASAISLALEISGSTLILDDLQARRVAERLGLAVTGTVGVLVRAKLNGIIESIKPILKKMRGTNFRLSAAIEAEALEQAGESNP